MIHPWGRQAQMMGTLFLLSLVLGYATLGNTDLQISTVGREAIMGALSVTLFSSFLMSLPMALIPFEEISRVRSVLAAHWFRQFVCYAVPSFVTLRVLRISETPMAGVSAIIALCIVLLCMYLSNRHVSTEWYKEG